LIYKVYSSDKQDLPPTYVAIRKNYEAVGKFKTAAKILIEIFIDFLLRAIFYSRPTSASAIEDWSNALERQLELYSWLQTSDGLLGGGVTNSWNSAYEEPPAEVQVRRKNII